MRVTVIVSTVVLGAGLLAGCGSGDDDTKASADASSSAKGSSSSSAYCKELKSASDDIAALQSGSPDFGKLEDTIETFHGLADAAPSEVEDDWDTLVTGFTKLQKTFEDAGVSMDDLATINSGQIPEGMSQADLAALGPKLQSAFTEDDQAELTTAGQNVEKHAKSECGIDLGE
jgi:uncharacterized phage infection (PIP) family protein YhgE